MAFGFRVFQVQRASQSLQGIVVGLLELLNGHLELRGLFIHLLLQVVW